MTSAIKKKRTCQELKIRAMVVHLKPTGLVYRSFIPWLKLIIAQDMWMDAF